MSTGELSMFILLLGLLALIGDDDNFGGHA